MEDPSVEVRIAQTGRLLLAVSLATIVFGLANISGPIFMAGALALLLIGICQRLSYRHLCGMIVSRHLPQRARAGECYPVETKILGGKLFPAGTAVRFFDPLAAVNAERAIVTGGPEPAHLRYLGKSMRRGINRSRTWTIQSNWPLGLFESRRRGSFEDSNPLIAIPNPFLPPELKKQLDRINFDSGRLLHAPPDPGAEFRLLREFRPRDPVRSIDWARSLSSRSLQVAELEPPRPRPRTYGLILHSLQIPGQVLTPASYEMILRIATGVLLRFQQDEIPLLYRHFPDKTIRLRNRTAINDEIDRLALSRRNPVLSLDSILTAAPEFNACDEVFILSDRPVIDWEEKLRIAFPRGKCIDAGSFSRAARPGLRLVHRSST